MCDSVHPMRKRKAERKGEFLSVRVSLRTKAELVKLADQQERSVSWIVGKIIDDHLDRREREAK